MTIFYDFYNWISSCNQNLFAKKLKVLQILWPDISYVRFWWCIFDITVQFGREEDRWVIIGKSSVLKWKSNWVFSFATNQRYEPLLLSQPHRDVLLCEKMLEIPVVKNRLSLQWYLCTKIMVEIKLILQHVLYRSPLIILRF